MARVNDLEARLNDWYREYAGGKYENIGWQGVSPLEVMMKYQGRAPQGLNPRRMEINSPADEVEAAVRALECQVGGRVPAAVLRCEYFATSQPRAVKISRLAKVGGRMNTIRFSQHLRVAKIHVAGWLRIPFSEPLTEEEAFAMLEYVANS